MNKSFKNIKIEDVLFFDSELVRIIDELKVDSRMYTNFQKKTRDRDSDEFLPDVELLELFKRKAALKMTYNKIVTVGIGYVYKGDLRIKALTGTEEEVILEFCGIASRFSMVCGYNIIAFDLPMLISNGYKYFDVSEVLPDRFITSGKKPWELKSCCDLMEVFKGSHFVAPSFDEVCEHFSVESPKSDIDGSQVSEVFYTEGVDRISEYVKRDVFASVQVFQAMRFEERFTDFIDVNNEAPVVFEPINPLEKLYKGNEFTTEIQDRIKELKGKKKLTKKDKTQLTTILMGAYVRTDFENMDQDSKKVIDLKREEVSEFVESL